MKAIYVEIVGVKGSAPRGVGTAMKVTKAQTIGTIGGGALEHQAIATARRILADGAADFEQTVPLGPGLGQCCGGSVRLLFTRFVRETDAPGCIAPMRQGSDRPLWIWGAGHVGRALVAQGEGFQITWVDDATTRFPPDMPAHAIPVVTHDMPRLVPHAPKDAAHLILTYSHDIDFALCAALLKHGFGFCGLIGSATKRARFFKRLQALGLDPSPLICPIGDKTLGKQPDMIAHGTLKALLARAPEKEFA